MMLDWLIRLFFFVLIVFAILLFVMIAAPMISLIIESPIDFAKDFAKIFGITFVVGAGLVAIFFALSRLQLKMPIFYGRLEMVGRIALGALVLIILVGGALRSCADSDRCTSYEARFLDC